MGDDSGDYFKDHESDNQHECDGQVASIRIDADGMRVIVMMIASVAAMVTVISGVIVGDYVARHQKLNLNRYARLCVQRCGTIEQAI